jgi:hypothetical protein
MLPCSDAHISACEVTIERRLGDAEILKAATVGMQKNAAMMKMVALMVDEWWNVTFACVSMRRQLQHMVSGQRLQRMVSGQARRAACCVLIRTIIGGGSGARER